MYWPLPVRDRQWRPCSQASVVLQQQLSPGSRRVVKAAPSRNQPDATPSHQPLWPPVESSLVLQRHDEAAFSWPGSVEVAAETFWGVATQIKARTDRGHGARGTRCGHESEARPSLSKCGSEISQNMFLGMPFPGLACFPNGPVKCQLQNPRTLGCAPETGSGDRVSQTTARNGTLSTDVPPAGTRA